jgi:hypothetical protein
MLGIPIPIPTDGYADAGSTEMELSSRIIILDRKGLMGWGCLSVSHAHASTAPMYRTIRPKEIKEISQNQNANWKSGREAKKLL